MSIEIKRTIANPIISWNKSKITLQSTINWRAHLRLLRCLFGKRKVFVIFLPRPGRWWLLRLKNHDCLYALAHFDVWFQRCARGRKIQVWYSRRGHGYYAFCARCWEYARSSSRIIQDILDLPTVFRKVSEVNGNVLPECKLRHGHRTLRHDKTGALKNKLKLVNA